MALGGWFAGILVACALAAPQAWAKPADAATACASAGRGQDSVCEVAGVRLHFVDWGGRGSPVILLSGLGDSARIFDDLAPRLARSHRVLAFTRRGYGLSDHGVSDFSNRALVGDVLGLMDALGIARASFVGHSIAGGELSALGADHPERVARLVYLDAAYDRTRALELTEGVPAGARPRPEDLASLAAATRWREALLATRSPAVGANLAQVLRKGAAGWTPSTPASVMLAVLAGDVAARPRYADIAAPALAFYTSKDVADQVPPGTSPQRRAEIVAYSVRRIRPWMLRAQADFIEHKACGVAVELPASTHYFFLRAPDATARAILAYLATPRPCAWRPAWEADSPWRGAAGAGNRRPSHASAALL
jgi:pimeloyl-ACP methyl ester carboxylesterase